MALSPPGRRRPSLGVVRLGLRGYREMVDAQERLAECRRRLEVGDLLLLLEHPPTYTRGRRSEPGDLPWSHEFYEERGIEVCDTPRGGRVTYHGPGQLIAYPICDLRRMGSQPRGGGRVGVSEFVSELEAAMVGTLARWGIDAGAVQGLTGVWASSGGPVPDGATAATMAGAVAGGELRKIGSIGLHIGRGISSHGLSINVSGSLEPWGWITPCGLDRARMTSIELESGRAPGTEEVGEALAAELATRLGRTAHEVDAGTIGLAAARRRIGLGAGAIP